MKRTLLVIDDQIGERGSVHQQAFLRAHRGLPFDFIFESCRTPSGFRADAALSAVQAHPDLDLVLLDIRFGEIGDRLGLEILRGFATYAPSIPVLMMSATERDVEALGRCLEEGAIGFVPKSLSPPALEQAVEQGISIARSHVLLGQCPNLRDLRRQAARLSPYDQIPVLIIGERGTGKERVARYVHHNGPRRAGRFVAVNSAGLAESLLEAELFGSEKGAYTGAESTRAGYLERAHKGVLFLDEIGNMPVGMQIRLLRVLQERSFRRVGVSAEEIAVDFQLVCATNEEPAELISQKRLREDFYDRVAAVTIRTPPLRDCVSDIPELVRHFLRELGLDATKQFAPESLDVLAAHDWPGNMRELRRVVQEAVVVSEGLRIIEPSHLPQTLRCTTRATASTVSTFGGRDGGHELLMDAADWPRARLLAELRMAVKAKEHIQAYKGRHWKAEFMRLMYPECRAQNAKGFSDLLRRLTKGPWGSPRLADDPEAAALLRALTD